MYFSQRNAAIGFLLTSFLTVPPFSSASEAIINGAFDTDRPIVLRGFASRQDQVSAFPKLVGTSLTGSGWYSTIIPDHFELWQPGFFGNPSAFGQHLELSEHAIVFQDFLLSDAGEAVFSFLYTRGLLGDAQFSVSIGLPGANGSNDGSVLSAVSFNPTGSFSEWQSFSANLSVLPGTYRISFSDITPDLVLDQPLIDQVSFVTVPEPSSGLLVALGLLSMGVYTINRRK
jgi:hypothetical protein